MLRRIRPKDWLGIHELRPHISFNGYWDFDGYQESQFLHFDNHWEWRNGYEVHTGYNFTYEGEGVLRDRAGRLVLPGEYSHTEAQLVFLTDQGDPFSFSTTAIIGGIFGGDRKSVVSTLRAARRGGYLELTWDWNGVDLPGGAFVVNLGRLRLSYAPTPHLLLQLLTQYNDRTDHVSSNLRFSWIAQGQHRPLRGLRRDRRVRQRSSVRAPRSHLIVKYSYLIDVFRCAQWVTVVPVAAAPLSWE